MMNLSARIRTVSLASLLAVALAVGSAPSAFAATSSTATYQKSEVVYASLSAAGAPEAVYVVNRFDVEKPGTVVDRGDYTKVQNLTNETELARQGDATTFEVEEGTLYYQGDAASTTLPWDVALAYELDGKKVKAEDLAGASGNLTIHVTTKQNASVDPAFYDSFMMQITFTLAGDVASDVAAEGATLASAGEDTAVAFTVLPGHDGDFTLTAKVQNFKMAGAQFAALPYSSIIEMPDTDQMVSGMTNLSDAVSALADGTASLASGVDELTSGAQSLSSGASAFGQGLNQLSGSSSTLVNASGEIKGALAAIAGGLQSADLSQLDQLAQLPAGLNQLADGLAQMREGYDTAHGMLGAAIAEIPAASLSDDQIRKLVALAASSTDPDDAATVDVLLNTYQAAQKVSYLYGKLAPAFDASSEGLAQQEAALRSMAASLDSAVGGGQLDQLTQLASGLGELSSQYGQFHDGLAQYASGLSALASNYNQLASGTADLAQGTGQLASGAGELSSGMGQLNASTITLPETMKEQVAEMTADYDFPTFDPVSFVSSDNANVQAVQFVMTTAAIEQPEAPQEEAPEEELTIWDRFVALFQG
jgi:putative membrane protein